MTLLHNVFTCYHGVREDSLSLLVTFITDDYLQIYKTFYKLIYRKYKYTQTYLQLRELLKIQAFFRLGLIKTV